MSDTNAFSKLYRSVGRYSRYAGVGFIVLSVLFLILAVSDQFVVFQIDSIIAFFAAIVLLLKDPRARVQARVLDALMGSADQTIGELSAFPDVGFTYVPTGRGVRNVVVTSATLGPAALPNGNESKTLRVEITPPGRGLANLYMREMGITQITMEVLRSTLSEAMRENFGLAGSVNIVSMEDSASIILHGASETCTCGAYQVHSPPRGSIGCAVASFLAVLVSAATERSVSLQRCVHDPSADAWTVSMELGPTVPVTK